uniref:Uncharacterized protein n=1 Tax=Knipowitschia caucasica TaxID=637954 RepID=A0AAV2MBD5_KNICA
MQNKTVVVRRERRALAVAPDCMVYCKGKMVGSAGPPPPPHPAPESAPDPATLERVSPEIQTLQLALLNCERRTDPKKRLKEGEVKQLEDIS